MPSNRWSRRCGCGCSDYTAGGRFLPGHDQRHRGNLLRDWRTYGSPVPPTDADAGDGRRCTDNERAYPRLQRNYYSSESGQCTSCVAYRLLEAENWMARILRDEGARSGMGIWPVRARVGQPVSAARAAGAANRAGLPYRPGIDPAPVSATIHPTTAAASLISGLAEARRFGVEIECYGVGCDVVVNSFASQGIQLHTTSYGHRTVPFWKLTTDASVSSNGTGSGYGHEVVSPILQGADGFAQLRRVCCALAEAGARVNRSCGLHVHLDAADLTVANVRLLINNYQNCWELICRLVSRTRATSDYANSWSANELRRLNGGLYPVNGVGDLANAQGSRYRAVNLHAYNRQQSIEFRQHPGTIVWEKIDHWVRFVQRMVAAAKEGKTLTYTSVQLEEFTKDLGFDPVDRVWFANRARDLDTRKEIENGRLMGSQLPMMQPRRLIHTT